MENFKEEIVYGYQLIEYNEDDRTFNIIFSHCFDHDQDHRNYTDEEEFLQYQYFLAQQYIKDDEEVAFALFCMDNFDDPIHHESPDNVQIHNCSTTKCIQYFNHQNILINQHHKVLFIMISSN